MKYKYPHIRTVFRKIHLTLVFEYDVQSKKGIVQRHKKIHVELPFRVDINSLWKMNKSVRYCEVLYGIDFSNMKIKEIKKLVTPLLTDTFKKEINHLKEMNPEDFV